MRKLKLLSGLSTLLLIVCVTYAHEPMKAQEVEIFEKDFQKLKPEDMTGNVFHMIASEWFLITAGDTVHYNSMTAAWGGMGILFGKPMATVFVHNDRFTKQFMDAGEVFTMSFFPESNQDALLDIYGRKSGRDTDKEKESGFRPVLTPDGGLTYLEASLVIVCRKIHATPLPPEVMKAGFGNRHQEGKYHTQYIGEIIGMWTKK